MGLSGPLRRLDRADGVAILAHLRGLDADDRAARFGHPVDETALAGYVDRLPLACACLLGRFDGAGALVGLAHLGPPDAHAEFGLSVLPTWRRQGVATALLEALAHTAAALGVVRLVCLHGHPAVLRAAARCHLPVQRSFTAPRALITLSAQR